MGTPKIPNILNISREGLTTFRDQLVIDILLTREKRNFFCKKKKALLC